MRLVGRQRPTPARRGWWIGIFRNLLVDVTGNTHRAEFCIDKLYSPDSATGRLGLLELRAFEMPPHARMSLAQQLLVRTLRRVVLARAVQRRADPLGHAAARPVPAAVLRRSGTCVASSQTCARPGIRSEPDWFAPHLEFRFPVYGRVVVRRRGDRAAPGHRALVRAGRGTGRGGTARYVDSSVERLQVHVHGAGAGALCRHLQRRRSCRCSPPAPRANIVCGVRYRAWQPPRCLHPTIPVHTPLVFDLVDHGSRAVARRLHLPRRPPGRPELRHVSGKLQRGRSPASGAVLRVRPYAGAQMAPIRLENPDFPATLDLRRRGAAGLRDSGPVTKSTLTSRAERAGREWRYRPPRPAHWDEALDASGRIRPHWKRLAAGLRRRMGCGVPRALGRRPAADPGQRHHLQRLRRSPGQGTPVADGPRAAWRSTRTSGTRIERAVVQRATLLNAILADLYGPQRLVRDRQLPPELLFANPGFLRPCHGIVPPAASSCRTTRSTWPARRTADGG